MVIAPVDEDVEADVVSTPWARATVEKQQVKATRTDTITAIWKEGLLHRRRYPETGLQNFAISGMSMVSRDESRR